MTVDDVIAAELNDTSEQESEEEIAYGPDDELWPGGPKMAQIDQWKAELGEDSIYVASLSPTRHVVWRTLTRFEYRRLVKAMEQAVASGQVSQAEANMNNEEQIAELCFLYPKYTRAQSAGEMAGVATAVSQEIMERSGFAVLEVRKL